VGNQISDFHIGSKSGYVASIIENEARLVFRHNYPAKAINYL